MIIDKGTSYQILDIPKESNDDEIKAAYIRLVKKHPPEYDPDNFIKIRKAYESLKDPEKRAKEDLFTLNFDHDNFKLPNVTGVDIGELNTQITDIETQLLDSDKDPFLIDQFVEILNKRAALYVTKKQMTEAISDWKKILELVDDYPDAKHNLYFSNFALAYGLAIHERYEDSIYYWEEALKYNSTSSTVIHNLAITADKAGKKELSEQYWKKTLAIWENQFNENKNDIYIKTCILELHQAFGGNIVATKLGPGAQISAKEQISPDKAIHEFREALKIDPNNTQAQKKIISSYMQAGRWQEAIQEIVNRLKGNRDDKELLNLLGQVYLNSGKVDEAFAVWNRVLSLDPKDQIAKQNIIDGHTLVGKKLRERGLHNASLVHFKSLLKYRPDDPEIHMEIGNTYALKGDSRSAMASWQTVLQIDPKHKEAKRRLTETRFK